MLASNLRVVHIPRSFTAAKKECETLNGKLLLLENADQVYNAHEGTLVGNVEGIVTLIASKSFIAFDFLCFLNK